LASDILGRRDPGHEKSFMEWAQSVHYPGRIKISAIRQSATAWGRQRDAELAPPHSPEETRMRKFMLAALALFVSVGLTLAGQVTFLGYDKDKKELKVKDGDKEKTLKVSSDTKLKRGDMDVDSEKGMAALEKMEGNEKTKGKAKLEVTTDGDKVTEIKMTAGKKKN
jgi:hypothetical protein